MFGFVLWIWLNIHFQWASLPAGCSVTCEAFIKSSWFRLSFQVSRSDSHTHTYTHSSFSYIHLQMGSTYNFSNNFRNRKGWWRPAISVIYTKSADICCHSIDTIYTFRRAHTRALISGHVPFRLISKTCYKYRFNSKSSSNSTVPMGAEALLPESMWNTFLTLSPSLSLAHFLFEYSKICGLVHGHSKFVQNIDGHFAFWSTK